MLNLRKMTLIVVSTILLAVPSTAMASPQISDTSHLYSASTIMRSQDDNSVGNKRAEASKQLRSTVAGDISDNQYELQGGGYAKGKEVMNKDGSTNDAVYEQLSSAGKRHFVSDIVSTTKKYTDPTVPGYKSTLTKSGVGRSTADNWFSELQKHNGMGSAMLQEILANTHPDFASANRIYEPFSGAINTFLGLLAVVLMASIGITVMLDLTYINIPMMQSLMSAAQSGGASTQSGSTNALKRVSWVSVAARKAVEEEESNGANAIWYYIKKRAFSLFFLGLALLLLVVGRIWVIVAILLDYGNGFIPS